MVGLVKVPLELLNDGLETKLEHLVLLAVSVLDLLPLGLELVPDLGLGVVELELHRLHDVEHVLLVLLVDVQDLRLLSVKLALQVPNPLQELVVELLQPQVLQVDQRVDHLVVGAQARAVLLLRLLQVLVEHLDHGVLPVHAPLVVLAEDLDFLLEALDLGLSHDLAPFLVDLPLVQNGVALLDELLLPELHP